MILYGTSANKIFSSNCSYPGKKITLNGAGEIFLRYSDEIFKALENAELELREYKGEEMLGVKISVESASLLVPKIIEKIREKFSEIKPQIIQNDQSGQMDWDLKIFSDYGIVSDKSSVLLMEEPIGVVMPQHHFLAHKNIIAKSDLIHSDFISLGTTSNLYKIISYYCEKINFSPNISMFVDSPSIMRDLLKMNSSIAFIPQHTWYNFYKDTLVFRTISDMPMSRCIFLSLNDKKYMSKSVKNCYHIITDCFSEYNQNFR